MSAHEPAERLPSDPEGLERLIDERRRRLAGTVDELVERAHPKEIARRGAAGASSRARAVVSSADGQVDPRRLAAVVAAVLAAVAVLVISRRRTG